MTIQSNQSYMWVFEEVYHARVAIVEMTDIIHDKILSDFLVADLSATHICYCTAGKIMIKN